VDAPNFNAEKDAEALRKAMKGLGTKESVLVSIAGNRSLAQRLQIKLMYKAMFGRVKKNFFFNFVCFRYSKFKSVHFNFFV
jgi:hypothetical protein